jgi:hypothetical protein
VSVIQLGRIRSFASEPVTDSRAARDLKAKLAGVELASEALIEALEASLAAAKLIKRISEQPTPATAQLLDVIYIQLQKSLTGLDTLLDVLKRL